MLILYNSVTDSWELWIGESMIYSDPNIYNVCSVSGYPLEEED